MPRHTPTEHCFRRKAGFPAYLEEIPPVPHAGAAGEKYTGSPSATALIMKSSGVGLTMAGNEASQGSWLRSPWANTRAYGLPDRRKVISRRQCRPHRRTSRKLSRSRGFPAGTPVSPMWWIRPSIHRGHPIGPGSTREDGQPTRRQPRSGSSSKPAQGEAARNQALEEW